MTNKQTKHFKLWQRESSAVARHLTAPAGYSTTEVTFRIVILFVGYNCTQFNFYVKVRLNLVTSFLFSSSFLVSFIVRIHISYISLGLGHMIT